MRQADSALSHDFSPAVDAALRYALAIGAALVLLVPGARGFDETLGWMPLWLLAMPAAAWWAARGFPLPSRAAAQAVPRRRRSSPQARRRRRASVRNPVRRPGAAAEVC